MSEDGFAHAEACHRNIQNLLHDFEFEHERLWSHIRVLTRDNKALSDRGHGLKTGSSFDCPFEKVVHAEMNGDLGLKARRKVRTPEAASQPRASRGRAPITPKRDSEKASEWLTAVALPCSLESQLAQPSKERMSGSPSQPSSHSRTSKGAGSDFNDCTISEHLIESTKSYTSERQSAGKIGKQVSYTSELILSSDQQSTLLEPEPANVSLFESDIATTKSSKSAPNSELDRSDTDEQEEFGHMQTDVVLKKIQSSAINRLRARLGVLKWDSNVTARQLFNAVQSLGLMKFNAKQVEKLVVHMCKVSGTDNWDMEDTESGNKHSRHSGANAKKMNTNIFKTASHLTRALSMNFLSSPSQSSTLSDGGGDSKRIPFQILVDFLVKDSDRQRLDRDFAEQLLVIKEVLLSGDANRLVAELTSVRVDDLAAPPPKMDWEMMMEPLVGLVILANGLTCGLQAEKEWESWGGWFWIELCFTLFFVSEVVARTRLLGTRSYFCGGDAHWNWFDCFIVITALVDTACEFSEAELDVAVVTIIRTFRLTRLTRLFRMLQLGFLRELNIMVKGLLAGFRTLFWALVLLFFTIYVLSVFTTFTIGRHPLNVQIADDELFNSVPRSMFTLFRCFVGDCNTSKGRPIVKIVADAHGFPFIIAYLASFIIVTLGLFNLIMALYVEITMAAAKSTEDKDKKRRDRESLRVAHITKKLLKRVCMCQSLAQDPKAAPVRELSGTLKDSEIQDLDEDMTVSKELFLLIVQDQEVQRLMDDLDVPPDRANLFDVLDADGTGDLHVTELVHGLLKVRGEARKSDVVASLLAVRACQQMVRFMEKAVLKNQERMMNALGIHARKSHAKTIWSRHPSRDSSIIVSTPGKRQSLIRIPPRKGIGASQEKLYYSA